MGSPWAGQKQFGWLATGRGMGQPPPLEGGEGGSRKALLDSPREPSHKNKET